jgi:ABC-2 type transport system ATP-binding protein
MLECINLDFFYGSSQRLKRVSFKANSPSLIGLFGDNGSGKTTLLKILGGALPLSIGDVRMFNQGALNKEGYIRKELRHVIGFLFQTTSSDEKLSAFSNLFYSAQLMGINTANIEELVKKTLYLANLLDRAHEPLKKLSVGMRRRLELYRTFIHDPKIVLLDEPTAGLDVFESKRFFSFLKDYQKCTNALIIMSTHHPEDLLNLERVLLMKNGGIIADQSPHALISGLHYIRCSFSLNDKSVLKDFSKELFDIENDETNDVIRAKFSSNKLDGFLQDPILRNNSIKLFSMEKPNIADAYKDLCRKLEV